MTAARLRLGAMLTGGACLVTAACNSTDGQPHPTDAAVLGDAPAADATSATDGGADQSRTEGDVGPFTFVVFGDMNGGACERNGYVGRVVTRMAAEPDVDFFISTGDIIDGWKENAGTLCFAATPTPACSDGAPAGNVAALLAPHQEPASGRGPRLRVLPHRRQP
jgi:hypothetical protein